LRRCRRYNFALAPQRGWATVNPCQGLELPAVRATTEIRFLTLDEVAGVLERRFQSTRWQTDDDFVFAHPATGGVICATKEPPLISAPLR